MRFPENGEQGKNRISGPRRWIARARAQSWAWMTQLFSRELLRDLYTGIFGREVDASGIAAYIDKAGGLGDRRAVIQSLLHSTEFQGKAFELLAPEIVRACYQGILGRDADPEGFETYSMRLAETKDLKGILSDLTQADEFRRNWLASIAPGLARTLYHGILRGDATPEELEAFTEELTRKGDLEGAVAGLLESGEFLRRISVVPVAGMAQALYSGILGREARPEELEPLVQGLIQSEKNLGGAVEGLLKSGEFQRRSFALLAPDIVQALYGWVLGRQADPEGLKIYSERLAAQYKVDGVMSDLFQSQEYRQKSFATLSRPLLEALYQGALQRDLDPLGWNTYRRALAHTGDIAPILSELIASAEFRRTYAAKEGVLRSRARARAVEGACWVFIHIAKTGGSSIQHLLAASLPPGKLYKEHDDTISQQPLRKLLPCSVFAGHFNYDSLPFIPRKTISLLTFVREPVERLCSFYNFLRAHEPGSATYARFHRDANELDMEAFFQNEETRVSANVWNQMTWAIMGASQWAAWQLLLADAPDEASAADFVNNIARPAIRMRLREFTFIGLQEDFERSARMLCDLLGVPRPAVIPAENTLAGLLKSGPDYKRELKPEPLTPARRELLESLVQLDRVLYEESKIIYNEKLTAQESPRGPADTDGASSLCVAGVEA